MSSRGTDVGLFLISFGSAPNSFDVNHFSVHNTGTTIDQFFPILDKPGVVAPPIGVERGQ